MIDDGRTPTPAFTATSEAGRTARPTLVVTLPSILESDPPTAREAARRCLVQYLRLPNYANNLLECGFDPDEVAESGSDRLVDALMAWGDGAAIRSRIADLHAAGADHVALIPLDHQGRQAHAPVLEAIVSR